MKNNQNKIDKLETIKQAITKTGYILERKTGEYLVTNGWTVINNRYYIDSYTNIQREIDLLAYKISKIENIFSIVVLLISCKKSDINDWVFFTKNIKENDPNLKKYPITSWTNSEILKYMNYKEKYEKKLEDICKTNEKISRYIKDSKNVYAFQEVESIKGKAQNDKTIYSSIDSLLKAAAYELKTLGHRKKEPALYSFNLLTIFDGNMYEVDPLKEPLELIEISNIQYINRFIVNADDEFYKLHFIKNNIINEYINVFEEIIKIQNELLDDLIGEYQNKIKVEYQARNLFIEKLKEELLFWINLSIKYGLKITNENIKELWLEIDNNELVIEIDSNNVKVTDHLNKDKSLINKTKKVLYEYYRYRNDIKYKIDSGWHDDIPF